MDISVGAEFVIAKALIVLGKRGVDRISFDQLRSLGWNIQKRCNAAGVDAIILTSGTNLKAAIYDFSDYFAYENIKEPMICIKKDVLVEDLSKRFMYCLPANVAEVIESETFQFLEAA